MVNTENQPAWAHPIVKGIAAVAAFVAIAEIIVLYIPPAWAETQIPISDRIVVQLGELPQWIIAIVAAGGLWKAWKAERAAADAAAEARAGVAKIEAVAVQIDGLLTDRDKAKVEEGEQKEKIAGAEKAATLAQGQREGRDSGAAAGHASPPPSSPAAPVASKRPLPVADDRTGDAAERSAKALERTADATEDKQK